MEAALADRGVDYRDRWRDDPATGRPVLTLRRICVLVLRHMPDGSPVAQAVAGYRPVSRIEEIVDDTRRVLLMAHGVKNPDMHPDRERARAAERERVESARAALASERRAQRDRELRKGV